ncbi:RagB/SusD family nutrient uptake outer membrane protein [Flavitalea flava]
MYKKIFPVIIIVLIAACTKNPTNIARPGVYSTNSYPQTSTQLFGLLVSGYAQFRNAGLYGFEFRSHDFDCLDHTADLSYNGDASWNGVATNNLTVSNNYAQDIWQASYTGIQYLNTFFGGSDYFEKNFSKPGELADINAMRGEAHFLRALYYFYLESFYGESYIRAGKGGDKMGVPLIASTATTLDSTQLPRATVSDTWKFIIGELQQSITLLQGKTWDVANQGRVTEWSAKALLGKVYVFTQDWANAKTVLKDVIDNSGKTLMPYEKYRASFIGIAANEFNEESLFEVNVDRVPGDNYGIFATGINLTSAEGLPLGPTIMGDDGSELHPKTLGYANEFIHDKNLQRFGFNLPLWTLVKNPLFDPGQSHSPSNPDSILNPVYRQQSLDARTNMTVDPRLYVNALQPWIDSASPDGKTWRPIVRYANIPSNRMSHYGWSFRKYNTFDNNTFNYSAEDAANIYILRLADIYLLYAETCANTSDNPNALEYLNKVHRRAYGYAYNNVSPVDYLSLSDKTSAFAAGDPVLGTNPLYYERWAELMGEGHWWFDVCRWQIGTSEATWYQNTAVGAIQWNDGKSYLFPIPNSEILSNFKIKQNPGYN